MLTYNKMSDTSDTNGTGNTKVPLPSKGRSRNWVFTWNNPPNTCDTYLLDLFQRNATSWVFQHETGEEEKTPHIQGYVEFKNARYFDAVKKLLGNNMHIEKCKSKEDAITYCQKTDTRTGPLHIHNCKRIIEIPLEFKSEEELWPWQKVIYDKLKEPPDDRTIIWVWEKTGCTGKSRLARYILQTQNAILTTGSAKDAKHAIAMRIEKIGHTEIVLFDFGRTQENKISYQAIEDIKNGTFFSGKYESQQIITLKPHIVCFANYPPNIHALSEDRWQIIDISEFM